jgi:hypothetical protein
MTVIKTTTASPLAGTAGGRPVRFSQKVRGMVLVLTV